MPYDLIVLGGGPAGYKASERAAKAGLSVLCIEERNLGGVCLNEGCIPTKTLLYSAKLYENALNAEKYGVQAKELSIDHPKVIARKNKVVRTLVAGVRSVLKASGVLVVQGKGVIEGRSPDGYAVRVDEEIYFSKRLLVATGSSAAIPPIPGLKEGLTSGLVVTSREILDLRERPQSLTVIGGGVIGLELASYFNSIGSKVTVVELLDHIAGENDSDLIGILQKDYEKRGIEFKLKTKAKMISSEGVMTVCDEKEEFIASERVLLSIGRTPNTKDIGLDSINVLTKHGAIVTDEYMKTNIPEVYAAGDVNGKSMLAHTAYREAEVAVNNMLGKRDRMRYGAIPSVLYTNPELSSVGETEETARNKGLEIAVVSIPMRFSGRYLAENEGGNGICKLVVDKKKNILLGAQALGNYSSEFIVAAGTFIELELPLDDIKEIIFPHPTVSEILREAVFEYK